MIVLKALVFLFCNRHIHEYNMTMQVHESRNAPSTKSPSIVYLLVQQKVFIIWHIQIDTLATQKSIHYELSCSRRDLAKVGFWQMQCG